MYTVDRTDQPHPCGPPQWWPAALAVGVLLTASQALAVAGVSPWLLNPAASMITAVVLVGAVIRRRPLRPGVWGWIAVFMGATAFGDQWAAAYTWLWHHPTPAVGGFDPFYLGGLAALLLALLTILRSVRDRRDLDGLLDMATVAVVGAFLAWEVIVSPTTVEHLSGLDRAVLTAYPVIDVALLALLVRLLVSRVASTSAVLLMIGLAWWVVADSYYLVCSGLAASGAWTVVVPHSAWVAGEVCFALAALHPTMRALGVHAPRPAPRLRPRRLVLAMAAFAVPIATDAAYGLAGRELNPGVVFLATAALGVLVIARSIELLQCRDRAEQQLQQREAYFHALAMNSADATVVLDADAGVIAVVGDVSALGRGGGVPAGTPFWAGIHEDDRDEVRAALAKAALVPDRAFPVEVRACLPDQSDVWIAARITNLTGHPEVRGYVVNIQDVTRRKLAEREVRHLALHDGLTELPNRTLFRDRLEQALRRSTRSGASVAVLFIDLDGFKNVNDSLGHDAGDWLLRVVARRFRESVRTADTVARFGGDEFAVLVEHNGPVDVQAAGVAERILQSLEDPVDLGSGRVAIRASIGIAIGTVGSDAGSLLRDADIAMYHAKASGKARAVRYEPRMQALVDERLRIESDLFAALEHGELSVAYQPVVELETGALTGFEALVRWHHPELGVIAPERFIPIAEDNGLIVPIDAFVLETACRAAAEWQARYVSETPLTMAINVSGRELACPDFVSPRRPHDRRDRCRPDEHRVRDHRNRAHRRCRRHRREARSTASPRSEGRRRRFRYGLLVAVVPPAVPGGHSQGRPIVREHDRRARTAPCHRPRAPRPRCRVAPRDHCRGRRDGAPARPAPRRALPPGPGIPVRQSARRARGRALHREPRAHRRTSGLTGRGRGRLDHDTLLAPRDDILASTRTWLPQFA